MSEVAHRFRFFVAEAGTPGAVVRLDDFDARHARVLHGAAAGTPIEVVDRDGTLWHGEFDGASGDVVLGERIDALVEPRIELFAFVTVGGRTDELVDGAVQAGATRIVPVVRAPRDAKKVDARRERLERVATSAAKQSKRASVPIVTEAIGVDELLAAAPGVVVDPDADEPLDAVVRAAGAPCTLLVGASDGFPVGLVQELVACGWSRGRLGHTVLRAELAAAVAVSIAAMHVSR